VATGLLGQFAWLKTLLHCSANVKKGDAGVVVQFGLRVGPVKREILRYA
jgi:hypothetical protein